MSATTFVELRERLFPLYFAGKFAEAYDLVTAAALQFPEHAERVLYWRACLACLNGNNQLAIDVLRQMLDQGYWYAPDFLERDEDLKPLHGDPAFEQILAASRDRHTAAQAESRPQRQVLPVPDVLPPYPLLVAMHGNHGNIAATTQWARSREHGFLVALAQSSQIVSASSYSWDDWDRGASEIKQHIAELQAEYPIDSARIFIGGFSMSGGLAPWLALSGEVITPGFISVGPYVPDIARFESLFAAGQQRPVRGFIIAGEHDPQAVASGQRICDLMHAHGLACELEVVAGLGHDFPPDWEARLKRALEYVTR